MPPIGNLVKTIAVKVRGALLNGHVVKLPSKYLCWHSYICSALTVVNRCFFLQWEAVNATAS